MRVEDPNALRFILQDEIYLLDEDKASYQTISKPQPEIETTPPVFNYLGSNKKHFLIIVNYPEHDFMPDEHLAALDSVLGRKGNGRDDIAILNIAKNRSDFALITAHFTPKTLLILGQDLEIANLNMPSFNKCADQDGINMLATFGFSEMMTNTENKKAFWEKVKSL